jgi:3-dehydroquinate synthetase
MTLMGFDKKNKSGNIQMILMKKPGDLITDIHCTTGDIADCLSHYLNKGDSKL